MKIQWRKKDNEQEYVFGHSLRVGLVYVLVHVDGRSGSKILKEFRFKLVLTSR